MSTGDFFWGKGGRCVRLTTHYPRSAERQENPGPQTARNTFGHLGLLRDDLYFTLLTPSTYVQDKKLVRTLWLVKHEYSIYSEAVIQNVSRWTRGRGRNPPAAHAINDHPDCNQASGCSGYHVELAGSYISEQEREMKDSDNSSRSMHCWRLNTGNIKCQDVIIQWTKLQLTRQSY